MGEGIRKSAACAAMTILLAAAAAHAQEKPAVTWDPAYSGNYTDSTLARGITTVVIHTVEGSASGARSWFKNPASNVSAHYIVGYGGAAWQMVADEDIAWHAGNWTYNTHSIGIEHEGYAGRNYWTDAEVRTSAALTRWLCQTYGIPMDRSHIIGHNEVPGATHTDPGPYFNWSYYMSLVRDGSSGGGSVPRCMQVTAGPLNVRTGPGTGFSIMATLPSGQRYVSVATQSGWHKIYYRNNTGWSYGGYLSQVTGATAVTVNIGSLNVRTGPGTGYAAVGTCASPQQYVRIAGSSGWHRIYYGGGAYWVYGGYTTQSGL